MNEVDATTTPAALVVLPAATVVPPAELHKSPEQMHVSTPDPAVHPFGKPVVLHDLITKM